MIRKAEEKDIAEIRKIDHIVPLEEDRSDFIANAVRSGHTYLLEEENRLSGYGVIKEDFFGYPFIEMLYIREDRRQKGLGPTLLRQMLDILESDKIFTSTNQSNKHMQHVLSSEGWSESGIIHNLDENDPEIVFCKKK